MWKKSVFLCVMGIYFTQKEKYLGPDFLNYSDLARDGMKNCADKSDEENGNTSRPATCDPQTQDKSSQTSSTFADACTQTEQCDMNERQRNGETSQQASIDDNPIEDDTLPDEMDNLSLGESETKLEEEVQCKDEDNKPVDWFYIYKIPKNAKSNDQLIKEGVAYFYITSTTVDAGWQLSKKRINFRDSIPGNTLAPLYAVTTAPTILKVLYNDHPPGKRNSGNKHSKGVVMANSKHGLWMIHSVPKFPPAKGEYSYPPNGVPYGQSFMCISVPASQLEKIGRQLMYNEIRRYGHKLPKSLKKIYPIFKKVLKHTSIGTPPYFNIDSIHSAGGSEFVSFAKSRKWGKELYANLVAPYLESNLIAQTRTALQLSSHCNGLQVMNVESIELTDTILPATIGFKSGSDHSKWAISATEGQNKDWVCVGDINRAEAQFRRGGGTVCLNSLKLWTHYRRTVVDWDPCD